VFAIHVFPCVETAPGSRQLILCLVRFQLVDYDAESLSFDSPCGVALALCWLINLVVVLRLWLIRRSDPLSRKLIWTLILAFLPILGLLFYAGFYQAPKPCSHEKDDSNFLG
jgi:uncharacterized membrane protein